MFSRIINRLPRTRFSTYPQNVTANTPEPHQGAATKILKVAIIGVPNAGKSTLINSLMDRKVCAVSSKVHTTRSKSSAIFTEAESQIVFLDTPGLVSFKEHQRYKLGRSFLKDGKFCLNQADLIGVIHDASNIYTRDRLDIKVIKLLEEFEQKPSFLVFNKIDVLKSKRKLLDLTRTITEGYLNGQLIPGLKPLKNLDKEQLGWRFFREIFMISALSGDGLMELRNYLISQAKPGEWLFRGDTWSDQSAEQLIVNSIKATLLDYLPQEIPYQLKPEMEYFKYSDDGSVISVVNVDCPSERIAKFVGGASDGKLRQITGSVQQNLQETFHAPVRIKIILKYPENN